MRLNIKNKAMIAMALSLLCVVAILVTYSLNRSQKIILDNTFEQQLPATLGEVSNGINFELEGPIVASQVLASSPLFTNYQQGDDQQAISEYLLSIKQSFNAITAFYVTSVDSQYFIAEGVLKQVSKSSDKDQWFYQFMANNQPFELSIDTDASTGQVAVFVNYAVMKNGKKIGVAGIGLSLDSLSKMIANYRIGSEGMVYLVDKSGIIKLHPDNSLIGKSINAIGLQEVGARLQNGEMEQLVEIASGSGDKIVSWRALPSIDWIVVGQVDKSDVLAELDGLVKTVVLMGLVILLLFTGLTSWLIGRLLHPFSVTAEMLLGIGSGCGDLTVRLDDSRHDEVGAIARGYNQFVEYLSTLLRDISNIRAEVYQSVTSIEAQASEMVAQIQHQTEKVEQVATAIHEMGASADEVANNAKNTSDSTVATNLLAEEGLSSVNSTYESVNQMNAQLGSTSEAVVKLANDTKAIDTVLDVISGVSEQTNLLALNAAIEAARAGEQGRGFAVVADEVRTLASRTQASASEIRSIIDNLQKLSSDVVSAVSDSQNLALDCNQAAKASETHLAKISGNVSDINQLSAQIATATSEQSNVVSEISPHISSIAEIAHSNTAMVEATTQSCGQLKQKVETLDGLIRQFKIDR